MTKPMIQKVLISLGILAVGYTVVHFWTLPPALEEVQLPPLKIQSEIATQFLNVKSIAEMEKSQFSAKPHRLKPAVDGVEVGFELTRLVKGGLLASLGLKVGDVIIRVENYSGGELRNVIKILEELKLKDKGQARMVFIRDGKKVSQTIKVVR